MSNKPLIAQRFNRNFESYQSSAQQQYQVACELVKHLQNYSLTEFEHLLELGCGTGFLTQQLLKHTQIEHLYLNDMAHKAFENTKKILHQFNYDNYQFIEGDAENIILPNGLDAVCSTSTFQWFSNLPMFLENIKKHLKTGGILAFSTFGTQNYYEIKHLTDIGLDYIPFEILKTEVQKHFKLLYAKDWQNKIWFNTPLEVLKHIKQTGVNGLQQSLHGTNWFHQFTERYHKLFSSENKVSLTYHPIIIIAQYDY